VQDMEGPGERTIRKAPRVHMRYAHECLQWERVPVRMVSAAISRMTRDNARLETTQKGIFRAGCEVIPKSSVRNEDVAAWRAAVA
jgi:hypothetical protein